MEFKTFEECISHIKKLIPDKQALTKLYYTELQRPNVRDYVEALRRQSDKSIVDFLTDEEIKYLEDEVRFLLEDVICIDDVYSAVEQERDKVLNILIERCLQHIKWKLDKKTKPIVKERPKFVGEKALKLIQGIFKINHHHLYPVFYLFELIDLEFLRTMPNTNVNPFVRNIADHIFEYCKSYKDHDLKSAEALASHSAVRLRWFLDKEFVDQKGLKYKNIFFNRFITKNLTEEDIETLIQKKNTLSLIAKQILLFCPLIQKYPKFMAECLTAFIRASDKTSSVPLGTTNDNSPIHIPDEVIDFLTYKNCFKLLILCTESTPLNINVNMNKLYEKAWLLTLTEPEVIESLRAIHNIIKPQEGYTTHSIINRFENIARKTSGFERLKLIKKIIDLTLTSQSKHMLYFTNSILVFTTYDISKMNNIELERRFGAIKTLIKQIVESN